MGTVKYNITVRSFATFDVATPGTEGRAEGDRIVARQLMEYLAEQLRARGLTTTSVAEHDSYGWYVEVSVEHGLIWLMLQLSDHWLLITRPIAPLLKGLFDDVPENEHQRVCRAMHGVLGGDGRFRNIRWYTAEDFRNRRPGSAEP